MKLGLIACLMFFCGSAFAHNAGVTEKYSVYQQLIEADSIKDCRSRNWEHNRKTWYGATVAYRITMLWTKWLENEQGQIVDGSLKKLVSRKVDVLDTDGVHRTEANALNECAANKEILEMKSFSTEEINEAIERFLK